MKPSTVFVSSLTAIFSVSAQTLPSLLDALRASGASVFADQIDADPTIAALYLSDQVQTVFAPIDNAYGYNFTRLGKRQSLTPAQQQALLLQSTQAQATIQSMRTLPGGSQIVTKDNSTLLKGKGQSVVSDAHPKKKTNKASKRYINRPAYPPTWTASELYPPKTWSASELYPPTTWTTSELYQPTWSASEPNPSITWTPSESYLPETWSASETYPSKWNASAPYPMETWSASESYPPKTWSASESYPTKTWSTSESYPPTWAPSKSYPPTSTSSAPPTPISTSSAPPTPISTPSAPPTPTSTPSATSLVEIFSGLGNSVNVIRGDIPYAGGLIQITDGQFTLPASLSVTVQATGESTFASLASSANLTDALDNTPYSTFFVPSNEAFADADALSPSASTASLLQGHVIPNFVGYLPNLVNGSTLTTQTGSLVTVTIQGDNYYINNALIVSSNLILENGVAHVIDQIYTGAASSTVQKGLTGALMTAVAAALFIVMML